MDIRKRAFDVRKNDVRVVIPETPSVKTQDLEAKDREFGKKYRSYLAITFVFLIAVFVLLGIFWVKSNESGETVEKNLKDQLMKDPVKSTGLANTQTSNSAQSQANSQTRQTVQSQSGVSEEASVAADTEDSSADETEETQEDDTQKFESSVLKVSFDYPIDALVSEGENLITLTQDGKSWKIRFYDNKNKKEFETWYKSHFDIETESDCSFTDPTVKVGSYTSKLVEAGSGDVECDGAGNYAMSSDKSRVVRVDLGKETAENANKILESFKFVD